MSEETMKKQDDLFRFIDKDTIQSEKITAPRYSYWASVFRVFFRKKINIVLIGLFILLVETLNSSLHFLKPELTENSVVYCTLRDLANHIFPILKTFITGAVDPAAAPANV